MRALISYLKRERAWRLCAENAQVCLKEAGWVVEPTDDSVADQFRYHSTSKSSLGDNGLKPIENYELTIHIAHGDREGFRVSERTEPFNERVHVRLGEIAPGDGRARYLWLIACDVLAHGPGNGSVPQEFNNIRRGRPPAGEANVYARWRGDNRSARPSPLGNGLRLVCGSSTLIHPSEVLLAPVFRLIEKRFMLADAFILGLVSDNQTPLCATQASRTGTNPLYDLTWTTKRNDVGDHLFIQYPLSHVPDPALLQFFALSPSSPPVISTEDGFPDTLPILEIDIDKQMADCLETLAYKCERKSDLVEINYDRSLAILSLQIKADIAEEHVKFSVNALRDLFKERSVVNKSKAYISSGTSRLVEQQVDSCPINAVSMVRRFRTIVDGFTKSRYIIGHDRVVIPAPGNREQSFAVLDPDLGVLLRLEPGETGTSSAGALPMRGLHLLTRGWSLAGPPSDQRIVELIGAPEAKYRAWASIERSDPGNSRRLDQGNAMIAIGYRLYPSEGNPLGRLVPHYVVTFPYQGGGDEQPGVVVEVPAPVEGEL